MTNIFTSSECTVIRPMSVWSVARSSSSLAATQPSVAATSQPSPARSTLECSTDGKTLKVIATCTITLNLYSKIK